MMVIRSQFGGWGYQNPLIINSNLLNPKLRCLSWHLNLTCLTATQPQLWWTPSGNSTMARALFPRFTRSESGFDRSSSWVQGLGFGWARVTIVRKPYCLLCIHSMLTSLSSVSWCKPLHPVRLYSLNLTLYWVPYYPQIKYYSVVDP